MEIDKKIQMVVKSFAVFGAIGVILFIFIATKIEGDNVRQYTKTKDSLEALINKYQYDYIELKKKADKMDSILNVKKDKLEEVKGSFNKRRKPTIKNSNEAIKYINKFLSE
jgi:hypothetical protein